jgi:hypothetical protein
VFLLFFFQLLLFLGVELRFLLFFLIAFVSFSTSAHDDLSFRTRVLFWGVASPHRQVSSAVALAACRITCLAHHRWLDPVDRHPVRGPCFEVFISARTIWIISDSFFVSS